MDAGRFVKYDRKTGRWTVRIHRKELNLSKGGFLTEKSATQFIVDKIIKAGIKIDRDLPKYIYQAPHGKYYVSIPRLKVYQSGFDDLEAAEGFVAKTLYGKPPDPEPKKKTGTSKGIGRPRTRYDTPSGEYPMTPEQDEVILAVQAEKEKRGMRFHTITLVFDVMTEQLGYRKTSEQKKLKICQKSIDSQKSLDV